MCTERARLDTFKGFDTERARLGTFRGFCTERARLGHIYEISGHIYEKKIKLRLTWGSPKGWNKMVYLISAYLNQNFIEKQPPYKEVGYNYLDLCTFFQIVKWGLCGGWRGWGWGWGFATIARPIIFLKTKSLINWSDLMKKSKLAKKRRLPIRNLN